MKHKKASKKIGIDLWASYYRAYWNAFGRFSEMQSREDCIKDAFETGWRYAYNFCEMMSWRWFFVSFFSGVITGLITYALALMIGC